MAASEFLIRPARDSDAAAIAAIYAHHVLNGTASYDIDPPSVDDMLAKVRRITSAGWPFIVAEKDGTAVGYAYVTQLRDRAAYRFTCENSIYVAVGQQRCGIGRALLDRLCDEAAAFGFRQMIAVVGGAEPASIALHKTCGFDHVGRLREVGFKMGRWLDTVYMQKRLADT